MKRNSKENRLMTNEVITNWVVNWFKSTNNLLSTEDILNNMEGSIVELGFVDSMNMMELISDIESEFNISLGHTHFEDERIFTVKGLTEIIYEESSK